MPTRITHHQFYNYGGFSNPRLFRRGRGDGWTYWEIL